jgi:hypothetical protein
MLDNLKQKYQQLITTKKWEGVGHVGMNNHNKSAFNATASRKMKHTPMLLMSIIRLLKGFSSSTNGPSFKPVIIVGIKDTFAQTARSISLRK